MPSGARHLPVVESRVAAMRSSRPAALDHRSLRLDPWCSLRESGPRNFRRCVVLALGDISHTKAHGTQHLRVQRRVAHVGARGGGYASATAAARRSHSASRRGRGVRCGALRRLPDVPRAASAHAAKPPPHPERAERTEQDSCTERLRMEPALQYLISAGERHWAWPASSGPSARGRL